MSEERRPPLLRIVRGNPDDAELAALTVVIAVVASVPAERPTPPRRSWWSDKAIAVRQPLHPGEGAWRASALPR
jgi:hypothetical protein